MTLRDKLIQNAVRNLKEFGYPNVNEENIFLDTIYKKLFISMLKDNYEYSLEIDSVLDELIKELE